MMYVFSATDMSLFLIDGFSRDNLNDNSKAEIISFVEDYETCPFYRISDYPHKSLGSITGGLLKNKLIVICGGFDLVQMAQVSNCYSLNEDLQWRPHARLIRATEGSASVVVRNGKWSSEHFLNIVLPSYVNDLCTPINSEYFLIFFFIRLYLVDNRWLQ